MFKSDSHAIMGGQSCINPYVHVIPHTLALFVIKFLCLHSMSPFVTYILSSNCLHYFSTKKAFPLHTKPQAVD